MPCAFSCAAIWSWNAIWMNSSFATVMINSFLNGSCGSCGVTQLTSSVVTGFVAQPASNAAALSSALDKAKRTILMTGTPSKLGTLEDAVADHGVENDIDVLRQCRIETL